MSITGKDISLPDEQGEHEQPITTSAAPGEQSGSLGSAPLLEHKDYQSLSVFTPERLLREARRQKGWDKGTVPAICVLDPDGDLVEYLHQTGRARRHATWACYHTVLDTFVQDEIEFGIVGRVVGASFAVLVAEELFASGCQLLISITSAGQIICFAHVTNQMGQAEGDFEKGEAAGSQTALHMLRQTAQAWHNQPQRERIAQWDAG